MINVLYWHKNLSFVKHKIRLVGTYCNVPLQSIKRRSRSAYSLLNDGLLAFKGCEAETRSPLPGDRRGCYTWELLAVGTRPI